MITKINNGVLTVSANGKSAGTYAWKDFTDEELRQEKYTLIGNLIDTEAHNSEKREEINNLYNAIAAINGELDKRALKGVV
ncbi:MAG: hypothetical protein QY317_16275 [Candidatus Jettenia caeni]|nr:MAG: hypothetical protein QY317_16275 [Candidatus Jettenia caeni]